MITSKKFSKPAIWNEKGKTRAIMINTIKTGFRIFIFNYLHEGCSVAILTYAYLLYLYEPKINLISFAQSSKNGSTLDAH